MANIEILQIIFEAIEEINETFEAPVEKKDSTVLFGKDSQLDSMGLVSLIVTVERLIEEKYGHQVDLVIDGGLGGLEHSTIVDCTGDEPEIVRVGAGELV